MDVRDIDEEILRSCKREEHYAHSRAICGRMVRAERRRRKELLKMREEAKAEAKEKEARRTGAGEVRGGSRDAGSICETDDENKTKRGGVR